MNKTLENLVTKPNNIVVLVIFIFSAAWMGMAFSGGGERMGEENIFKGKVLEVVSERDAEMGLRTGTVQELLVEVDLLDRKEVRAVLNDFVPLRPGDELFAQAPFFEGDEETWYVVDVVRWKGLAWLALLFVVLVYIVSRKKGLFALVGLMFSFVVVFSFILPRMLQDSNAVLVGITGAVLILLVTLYVSYGLNRKSISALLGITFSLLVVGLLAHVFVGNLFFTGFGAEESLYLHSQTDGGVNLAQLLIVGIIIAAIGVLDDVAITQASVVLKLASVNRDLKNIQIFKKAMEVGKDHIAAVINTLVLAYTGAALPLLLLLMLNQFPPLFAMNGEVVAEEIVRTLISTLGLILAVPLTTAIAVMMKDKTTID